MRILYESILGVTEGFILHQVNCRGKAGAGLALKLARQWPDRFVVYRDYCRSHGVNALGDCIVAGANPAIVHLFGQVDYGSGLQTDYKALEKAISQFVQRKELSFRMRDWPVAVPYGLGCGLAGGDWLTVEGILQAYLPDCTLYHFTPPAPAPR